MSSILERLETRLLPDLVDILRGYLEAGRRRIDIRECVSMKRCQMNWGHFLGVKPLQIILNDIWWHKAKRNGRLGMYNGAGEIDITMNRKQMLLQEIVYRPRRPSFEA